MKGRDCQRGLGLGGSVSSLAAGYHDKENRKNEGEWACTDLLDVGSRLIHFHKSFRDVSASQPVRAWLQSPGFPSLLGAVDVFSPEQCSCTPQIPARSWPAMVLKWMVIQIADLAAACSYRSLEEDKKIYCPGPGTWSGILSLLQPCRSLSPASRDQLLLKICQKPDCFSA